MTRLLTVRERKIRVSGQMAMALHREPLLIDSFAGGGGASRGIELALGRSPDISINHDPEAVALHAENHPTTRHHCESVWRVKPREATGGRFVGALWASPDCKHFSKAKGGKPVDGKVRALAWSVVRWAADVRPSVLFLENVEEFQQWGPLVDGRPCPLRRGQTFRAFIRKLERLGYVVEWRELRACDYGAPTTRKRLFLIARCDGQSIVWPAPSHGPGLRPYRTAAECIDWSLPVPSIFDRDRPLAEPTLARIARGIAKFALVDKPFLVHQGNGERPGQAPRIYDIDEPLRTVVAGGVKQALVVAFLAKHYGGHGTPGSSVRRPFDTVTCKDHHALVTLHRDGNRRTDVRAFLTKYYGAADGVSMREPIHTITTRDRFGLVEVESLAGQVLDIGMRMLTPRELFRAQGFDDDYRIDLTIDGKPLSKTAQVRMAGNSVCPPIAAALVRANVGAP